MVRTAAKNSNGFVRYDWPKPGSEDISRGAPKLSAVRLIPEWGWVIGTGAYIDDAMDRAKESARESIREMRYDNGTGYFWINNATLPFPTMIMHPTAPNLEGKVLDNPAYNSVGENKENLFVKSVEGTTVSESGYIDYLWPKPTQNGLSEEMPKISFVRLFEPWNWIVGTGLYTDDIDEIVAEREAAMKAKVVRIILVFVAITLLVAFVAMSIFVVLLRFISRPINDVVKWSHGLAAGDLTQRIKYTSDTEIGQQGHNLNRAAESIRILMSRIKELAAGADETKDRLASSTEETAAAIAQISNNLGKVDSRFTEMDNTIVESSSAAEQISANIQSLEHQISLQASSVEESSAAIEEMLSSINNIARTSEEKGAAAGSLKSMLEVYRSRLETMNNSINFLNQAGEEMGEMANVIGTIASKTNLLSLNAAIEAAHAGEAGSGFAVVAGELQNLAASAGENAKKIKTTLKSDIQEIETLKEESRQMNDLFTRLESEIGSMADALAEISRSMVEISHGSNEILTSVETLRGVSTEVLAGSKEMTSGNTVVARSIDGVANLSKDVGSAISEVRVGTGQINLAMQSLNEHVRLMVESIQNINREVAQFRT